MKHLKRHKGVVAVVATVIMVYANEAIYLLKTKLLQQDAQ